MTGGGAEIGAARRARLRGFYEAEAAAGTRDRLPDRRIDLRRRFTERVRADGRHRVLDLGAGPGLDVAGFAEDGLVAVGVDLAVGNGHLARSRGVTVVAADVAAVPVFDDVVDAAWSLSVLMHLDDAALVATLDELVRVTRSGGPVVLGLWPGGRDGEAWTDDETIPGERRYFERRPAPAMRRLLEDRFVVEDHERWDPPGYDVYWCRVPD